MKPSLFSDYGMNLTKTTGINFHGNETSTVFDTIMWMDHRAKEQAQKINKSQHSCLKIVGDSISPEMQLSKILWLKENRPDIYYKIGHLMDLTDFLTFRASGNKTRLQIYIILVTVDINDIFLE